jgi:hypothetical protein
LTGRLVKSIDREPASHLQETPDEAVKTYENSINLTCRRRR